MPREDPIGFRVERPNHSTIASGAIKLSALCSTSSFQCEPLDAWLLFQSWIFNTKKISLPAGFEPALEDPIRFRVQRPNRSAIAAGAIKLSALCSTSSFQCEPLDAWLPFQSWISFFNTKKISLRAGFEPAREDPIGFRVQRLNHSAIAAGAMKLSALCSTSSFQFEPLDAWLSFQRWFSLTQKGLTARRNGTCEEDPIGFRVQSPNHSTIASGAMKLSALCLTSSFHFEPLDAWLFSKDGSLQYKKVLLHAEIEPAREDPNGFRVQRPNHSAIASGAIKLSALCSTSSFQCELLDAWLFSKDGSLQHKKVLLHAEIEPAREDPIGFRVQRRNHSAIAAGAIKLSALCSTTSFQCEPL